MRALRGAFGIVALLLSIFTAFAVRQVAEHWGFARPERFAVTGLGIAMVAIDLTVRHFMGARGDGTRFVSPTSGGSLHGIPMWTIGVLVAVAGLTL